MAVTWKAFAYEDDVILKAFMAAKGDLIGASGNDTPVILSVGTNDYVLTADSGEASGLKWGAQAVALLDDIGDVAAITEAQGQILYRDTAAWDALGVGTSGQALITGGAAANPAWGSPAADYGGTGINSGSSTGVPKVATGTWSIDAVLNDLGAATGAVDFNNQQLTDACIATATENPSSPGVGQIYFKTGDSKIYICTVST